MKNLQKLLAGILACVMVFGLITAAAPVTASAAKKPTLAPKKYTLQVKKSKKIVLKNARKARKTKWTAKPAKAVKLSKKKKTSVIVKGIRTANQVTIKAKFKLGKKNTSVKMTIKIAASPTKRPTPKPATGTTQTPSAKPTTIATQTPSPVPTAIATQTASPVPTTIAIQTPSPVPTAIVTQTASPVPTAIVTQTASPVPTTIATQTASPVPTAIATQTASPVPTTIATQTPSPVPTTATPEATDSGNTETSPPEDLYNRPGPDDNGRIVDGLWTPERSFEMTLTRRNCNESDIENGMGDLMFLSDNGFTYTADAQYNAGLRFNICRFGAEYVTDLSDFDYMEYELEDYIDQNGRKLESSPQLWGEASDGSPGNMYRDKAEAYEPMIAGIPGSIINITEDGADRIVRTPMKLLNYEGYFNAARYATVSLNNEYGNRGTVTHIRFIKNEAPDYVSKDVPQNLTLKTPNDRVKEGATSFLIPVITNKNGIPVYDGIEYEWFSSDPSIATVDEDGIITGINANATPAVITVKLKGTEISSSISITVYKDMPPAGIRLSQANNFRTCTVEELKRGIVLNPQAIDSNGFPMPKITCENPVVTVEEAGGTGATASEADADGYITLQSDTAKAGTIELKLVTSDAFAAEPAILVMDIIDGYRVPIYNAYNASQNAAETIFDTSGYQASLNVTSSAAYNNGIGFIVDLSGISDDNPDLTIADIGGVYANAATSGGWLQMFTPNDLNGAGNWTAPIIACTDAALQSGNNWTNAAPVSGQIDVIDGIYRADFDFSGEKSVSGNTPPSDLTGSYFNFAFGVDGINTMTIADVILIPKAAE